MNAPFKTVMVGTKTHRVSVGMTESASRIMDDLPSNVGPDNVLDQDALLSTIVISKAASGELVDDEILLDASDILDAIDQPSLTVFVDAPSRR